MNAMFGKKCLPFRLEFPCFTVSELCCSLPGATHAVYGKVGVLHAGKGWLMGIVTFDAFNLFPFVSKCHGESVGAQEGAHHDKHQKAACYCQSMVFLQYCSYGDEGVWEKKDIFLPHHLEEPNCTGFELSSSFWQECCSCTEWLNSRSTPLPTLGQQQLCVFLSDLAELKESTSVLNCYSGT